MVGQPDFPGRCINEPVFPCIGQPDCQLADFCRRTDAFMGINPTTHGRVIQDLFSPDQRIRDRAQATIRRWRAGKRGRADANGIDPIADCPR